MKSQAKFSTAVMVMDLIQNERSVSFERDLMMRDFFLSVIDIKKANDPSPRAGCGYSRPRSLSKCEDEVSPENGRADDYYEHGSHQ